MKLKIFVSFFQVKFTSYPDLSKEERKKKFEANCLEGYTEIVSDYFSVIASFAVSHLIETSKPKAGSHSFCANRILFSSLLLALQSISSTGLVLVLAWNPKRHHRTNYGCDFVKEPGKVVVVITSHFIFYRFNRCEQKTSCT